MTSFERFTTKTHLRALRRFVTVTVLAALAVKLACTAAAAAAGGGWLLHFLLRAPASVADAGSALLVFEVLRRRRPLHLAARAAALVGASPVLLVASGVHGDRLGVAVLCLLAAMWLLVDRDGPLPAGLALAVAVRVEPLAVAALPVALAAAAWARPADAAGERDRVTQLALAFTGATVAAWAPALAWGWQPLGPAPAAPPGGAAFGPGWLAARLGLPGLAGLLAGPGRLAVLLVAVVPAVCWVRFRPGRAYAAVGLVLLGLVALDPAPSPRDLAWPVVFGYLGDARWASAYGLAAGPMLAWTSALWRRGVPWAAATGGPVDGVTTVLGLATWAVLLAWLAVGVRTVALERGATVGAVTAAADHSRRSAPVPK
jgi:hypothetical protein